MQYIAIIKLEDKVSILVNTDEPVKLESEAEYIQIDLRNGSADISKGEKLFAEIGQEKLQKCVHVAGQPQK